jgi:DNA-binding transcriptional ArsR family regulator
MARAATTTDVFNAIAEAKRREMIGLLNNGKYWTVSEIVGRMKITQPTASKHLSSAAQGWYCYGRKTRSV